jgi:hypothetical protein
MNATTPAAGEQPEDDSEDIETKIADLPADEASNRLRRRLLLARFWRSARGFWGTHGDRLAWLLTGSWCRRIHRRRSTDVSLPSMPGGFWKFHELREGLRIA